MNNLIPSNAIWFVAKPTVYTNNSPMSALELDLKEIITKDDIYIRNYIGIFGEGDYRVIKISPDTKDGTTRGHIINCIVGDMNSPLNEEEQKLLVEYADNDEEKILAYSSHIEKIKSGETVALADFHDNAIFEALTPIDDEQNTYSLDLTLP